MHRMTSCAWVGTLALLAGCGDDAAGPLAVIAVDEDGVEIAGAEVTEEGSAIVVRAEGFAPAVVVGASSGQEVALEHADTSAEVNVSGTIPGWDALAAPAAGRYLRAIVSRSRSAHEILVDGAASIDGRYDGAAQECLRTGAAAAPCAWSLSARPGTISVVATALEMEGDGASPSDDTVVSVLGVFVAATVDVGAAGSAGVVLEEATAAMLDAMLPSPSGLEVVGVPGIGLDAGARAILFPPGVLALPEGPLADGRPWLVVDTYNDGHLEGATVEKRDLDPGAAVIVGAEELPAAPAVSVAGSVVRFDGAAAGARYLRVRSGARTAWTAWLGDAAEVDAAALGLPLESGDLVTGAEFSPRDVQTPADGRAAGRRVIAVP